MDTRVMEKKIIGTIHSSINFANVQVRVVMNFCSLIFRGRTRSEEKSNLGKEKTWCEERDVDAINAL